MLINKHLRQSDRDKIMETLNKNQQNFLNTFLKRGKKTAFANVMAKEKTGLNFIDGEEVADQWELLNYLDAGSNWREFSEFFCECGRKLRYQYVVKNRKTGNVKKFGTTHFEEHTGISSQLAKEILRGFERIDYELDEILWKINNGWQLMNAGIENIPAAVDIPKDIKMHFDYEVPLLERQVKRLLDRIYALELRTQAVIKKTKEKGENRFEVTKVKKEIQKIKWFQSIKNNTDLSEDLKLGVITYLKGIESELILASEVCESLVIDYGAPSKALSSGTYYIYPDVCLFLKGLEELGVIKFNRRIKWKELEYKIIDPYLLQSY